MRRGGPALAACASLALACATPEPILYPNATLEANGQEQADHDTDQCSHLAEEHEAAPNRGGEIAGTAVEDAAVGGAAGAAAGAIFSDVGRGAAGGAAAGAAGGLVRGIFRTRRDPDPVYRHYMERCLSDKGYEVIGWR